MMNPSELRDKVTIIKKELVYDKNHGVEEMKDIIIIKGLRAKKKTVSTKDYMRANADNTKVTYKFIVRKRDIDESMYLIYKDKQYEIKHVHEFEDHMYLELAVEEVN
ncbi:head-tail adaptor protein [Romboutsia ilealis]|uniref:Phage head closure protein n=1 Tax=Romboutsia faecis TaxID=2764597 RepID=A0ABR7JNG2_9FIRM|nr:phage head closure protein [Romboutsia faecis]MBC5996448.1 phage head closure protein [Romboutsia faecis]MRN26092.1 head-tail adaptor protein [Romboutsia ilealis]